MGEEKKEKGKMINFWTWFDKEWGSFVEELLDKNAERNDIYIYQTFRYPPKSTPPINDL